jgi:hypothetical protein
MAIHPATVLMALPFSFFSGAFLGLYVLSPVHQYVQHDWTYSSDGNREKELDSLVDFTNQTRVQEWMYRSLLHACRCDCGQSS